MVTSPPNPQNLQSQVSGDLAGLFLILALISLLIGAVGIANTTLVAVLERTEEIGLRRAVGARPRHIAAQFLAESTALGTLGGLIGTCIGVGVVVIFAAVKDWTAVLNPAYTLPAPLIGSVVGLLAGAYPALRAARTSPLAALVGARERKMLVRIRPGLVLLIICGAGLSACTAGAPTGPDVTVSTPAVGRPQPPSSVQAALSSEAFTPYAALGQSNNDGLAPGESTYALSTACMSAAGYERHRATSRSASAPDRPTSASPSRGGRGDISAPPKRSRTASGSRPAPRSASWASTLPDRAATTPSESQAEQTAIGKCATITGELRQRRGGRGAGRDRHAEQRYLRRCSQGPDGQRRRAGLEGMHGQERL